MWTTLYNKISIIAVVEVQCLLYRKAPSSWLVGDMSKFDATPYIYIIYIYFCSYIADSLTKYI